MYAQSNHHPQATWRTSAPPPFWQQQEWQREQQQYHQHYGMQQQPYHLQQQQHYQHRPQQQQQQDRRQPYHNQQQANSSRGEQASRAADCNSGRAGLGPRSGTQPQQSHRQQQQQQAAASTPSSSSRPHKRARGGGQQQEQPQTVAAQQPPPRAQPQAHAAQQPQPGAQLRQPPPRALPAPWLNVLRDELLQFAQAALPSPQEDEQRRAALSSFQAVVQSVLGSRGIEVMLFGSARAGLALHSSDLDVMITGLCSPTAANGGFSREGKQVVVKFLRKVMGGAHSRMSVRASRMIAHARIPVLKLELANGIELDVSLNDGSGGVSAANFLQSWQQDFPALRPLVLVLKSVLKHNNLADVASGGLGSWSLALMCIAHLMAEDSTGGQVDHVGAMLFSFLRRYGVDWDINRDAVAVGQGGIVSRDSLATAAGPFAGNDKLAVKDPLTGREVAGGSHRYADVQRLWQVLFVALRDRGPAAAASAGQYYGVLSLVLDCGAALQRAGGQQQGGYGAWGAGAGAARGNDDFDNYMQGGSRKRNR